jgi:DHA2 family methylenomycin A resistance protein-like MFS transporter
MEIICLIAAVSLGYFVVQLDVSIVNLCLPTIQQELGVDSSLMQWIVNAYVVAFSVLLLSAGVLGDRYGSRRLLVWGYAAFFVGSAGCGLAASTPILLAARIVQGVGAAIIVPNSLSILNKRFDAQARLRVMLLTVWMSFGGAALASGPVIGGAITSIASWRYIFLINLPICGAGVFLTLKFVPKERPHAARRHDFKGQLAVFLAALALLVLVGNYRDLGDTVKYGLAAAAIFGALAFLAIEKNCADPAIPLALFRSGALRQALVYAALVNFTYFGLVLFLSLYFRHSLAMSPLDAGLAFLPVTTPLIVANIASGYLDRRYGAMTPIHLGFALLIAGMLLLSHVGYLDAYREMLPGLVLVSLGVGLITPMITSIAIRSTDATRGGTISAVVNFFRQIAGAFGVAAFGLFADRLPSASAYMHFCRALEFTALACAASIVYFYLAGIRGQRLRESG